MVEAMRENGAIVGGERSGHLVFMEHGTCGDGLLAGLQLLRIMREQGKRISELAGLLKPFPQTMINVSITARRPLEEVTEIQSAKEAIEAELGSRGRVLLRYSGTEPVVRVMVEGEDALQVQRLAGSLAEAVKAALR